MPTVPSTTQPVLVSKDCERKSSTTSAPSTGRCSSRGSLLMLRSCIEGASVVTIALPLFRALSIREGRTRRPVPQDFVNVLEQVLVANFVGFPGFLGPDLGAVLHTHDDDVLVDPGVLLELLGEQDSPARIQLDARQFREEHALRGALGRA